MAGPRSWACVALLASLAIASDGKPQALTHLTFPDFVASDTPTLVEFYAPWCGHCQSLAPEYEKAAADLEGDGIGIATVDATVEEGLAKSNKVAGYPTLRVFRGGRDMGPYNGPRTAEGIASHMRQLKTDPPTEPAAEEEGRGMQDDMGMGEDPNGDPYGEEEKPAETDAKGSIDLDSNSFFKIAKQFDMIMFFATRFEAHSTWTNVLENLDRRGNVPETALLVTLDSAMAQGVHEKYNISDSPSYAVLRKGTEELIRPKSNSAGDLIDLLYSELGCFGGDEDQVASLHFLARGLLTAPGGEVREAYAKAQAEVAKLAPEGKERANGELYAKIFKKANEVGGVYLAKENLRVKKLAKGKLSQAKLDQFAKKQVVLSSFIPKVAVAGLLDELHPIASGFLEAKDQDKRLGLAKEVAKLFSKEEGDDKVASYYLDVMQKAIELSDPEKFREWALKEVDTNSGSSDYTLAERKNSVVGSF